MNSLTANNRLSQQLVVSVAAHLLLRHECRLPNHLAVSNHRELYLTVGGELCRNLTAGFVTEEDFMFMLFVGSQKHSALSIFAKTTRMSALVLCGNSGVILLSVKDHQHIDSAIPGRYTVQAPYKAGAGIGVLVFNEAHNTRPACFFVPDSHTLSMVGCMGLPSGRLVTLDASKANSVQSTASKIGLLGGGYKPSIKEAATCWLLPLPKNRNLSGLSPQFAAIARQLPPKFTISPQRLSRKPAAFWRGITFAFLPDVFAQGAHMLNYFRVAGCATARSGELVEFVYIVDARSAISAKAEALNQARNERLSHIQITRVREVAA